ncbi:PREDICTED: glutamyl-tRNA(Gln) amidotransferase subunit B, mitochondrial [Ceratosolen solmsi marchali]|uniref:Glutamyl-tRNA(Gln) amidotransferase subunit B, mitochondrial n=1 Tax=Ceratosolen solmsi marchali TaxID=326594 RepID=A0AAJ6YBN1_9HYME|nr:PREDICTED: glutamyl-tRNA(Gln) amidotransferase subunit B, mitochondrial [Ceratosolen solmsi marchali]
MKLFSISRCYVSNNSLKQNSLLINRCFCNKVKENNKIETQWHSVVGLEIHAQISSNSKLFSGSSTEFGNPVNSCVSYFDCATPGTLPALNRKCVEASVITALALSCKVNEISLFDRKHYFYADLPAGYQITQQRQPIAVDGKINFHVFTPGIHKEPYFKSCKLKQIQIEQDSGKTIHDDYLRKNLIDLNRAGNPLMEFVFEPTLNDGEEAAALVKELMLILQRLDTCSCKMAEGALRVDANISINKCNEALGVRTEVKNIGSVRSVAAAIKYEIQRQISIRNSGGVVVNETRDWDECSGKTIFLRGKESYQDYRFMPEPNLPPLHIHTDETSENKYNLIDAVALKNQIPEMPQETRDKLKIEFNISKSLIIVLVNFPELLQLFFYIIKNNGKRSPNIVAKILVYQTLTFIYKNKLDLAYCFTIKDHLCELIDLLQSEKITLLTIDNVLMEILKDQTMFPSQIIERNNWIQINNDDELRKICQDILNKYPRQVKQYKGGKKQIFKYFVRQIKESTNERANMSQVVQILNELLK